MSDDESVDDAIKRAESVMPTTPEGVDESIRRMSAAEVRRMRRELGELIQQLRKQGDGMVPAKVVVGRIQTVLISSDRVDVLEEWDPYTFCEVHDAPKRYCGCE